MNPTQNELLRRLEWATSQDDSLPLEARDSETVQMREGWLALTRLLAAAESEIDSANLVPPVRPAPAPRQRRIVLALAVAASFLLAVPILHWLTTNRSGSHLSSPQARNVPRMASEPVVDGAASGLPAPLTRDDETLWEDDVDEQLATAQNNLFRLRWDPAGDQAIFNTLQLQLQQIRSEIDAGSL
jgi:hypothetical protein